MNFSFVDVLNCNVHLKKKIKPLNLFPEASKYIELLEENFPVYH